VCPICFGTRGVISQCALQDYEYRTEPLRRFAYYECEECSSEFMFPRPTEAEILSFYPDDYHAYHDDYGAVVGALVWLRNRIRARFYVRLLGSRSGRLFDVGPGDCRHFDSLKPHCDLDFYGVELNPEVAARAQQRGYRVVAGTLETMDLSGHEGCYGIVSMYHLLEHVIEPRLVVQRAQILLRPGGWIVGQLPCKDSWERQIFGKYWVGYHYPRHLQAFSRRGLRRLLEEAGFADVRLVSVPHLSTAISLQNFFIGRGWRPALRFGRSPIFRVLLGAVVPFEVTAYAFGRTGIVNFLGRKS